MSPIYIIILHTQSAILGPGPVDRGTGDLNESHFATRGRSRKDEARQPRFGLDGRFVPCLSGQGSTTTGRVFMGKIYSFCS